MGNYRPDYQRTQKNMFATLVILAALAVVFALFYGTCAMCRSCRDKKDADSIIGADGQEQIPQDGQLDTAGEQEDTSQPVDAVEQKARQLLSEMSAEQKIGQLILTRGDSMTQEQHEALISEIHPGGAVLFKKDFDDKDADAVRAFTASLQNAGGGHMLLCVDEEGGDVVRLSSNTILRESRFRSPQKLYESGGFDAIASDTKEKCSFLRQLGLNVNFAPVADVVTDPEGFLYKRSFGSGAEQTAQYVGTVVSVMREEGMGSSIKHFPGYGNAHGDTHEGLVESAVTSDTLRSSDLIPFIRGIESGADSVMVTHTVISCIDGERPCSLSPACISLLRDELGFDGVVITDGLDMGAIKKYCGSDDPCVKAFAAGCDLMCTPENPRESYKSLLEEFNSGNISAERLDESVMRILRWKIRLGLYE